MTGLSQTITVGDKWKPLNKSNVTSITLNGEDITEDIEDLEVTLSSITSNGSEVEQSDVSSTEGTYTVKYRITFKNDSKEIDKTITQTVIVNKKVVEHSSQN